MRSNSFTRSVTILAVRNETKQGKKAAKRKVKGGKIISDSEKEHDAFYPATAFVRALQ